MKQIAPKNICCLFFIAIISIVIFAKDAVMIKFHDGSAKVYFADKLTFSKTDSDGVVHESFVSQLIEDGDNTTLIPLSKIDSVLPTMHQSEIEEYVLNRNTHVLNLSFTQYCEAVREDGIVVSPAIPSELLPKVGEIIIARASMKLPSGILGRVEEISKDSDGKLIIATESVSLSEAFDRILLKKTVDVSDAPYQEGRSRAPLNASDYSFSLNKDNAIGGEGSVSLGTNITININIDKAEGKNITEIISEDHCGIDMEGFSSMKSLESMNASFCIPEKQLKDIILLDSLLILSSRRKTTVEMKGEGEISNHFQLKSGITSKKKVEQFNWGSVCKFAEDSKIEEGNISPWNFTSLGWRFDGKIDFKVISTVSIYPYATQPPIDIETSLEWSVSGHKELPENPTYESLKEYSLKYVLNNNGRFTGNSRVLGLHIEEWSSDCTPKQEKNKSLSLVPTVKNFSTISRNMQLGSSLYKALITAEITGSVLSKDMAVEFVLADDNLNVLDTSESHLYGSHSSMKQEYSIFNVSEGSYKIYPKVNSSVFMDYYQKREIDLSDLAKDFDIGDILRKLLTRIYNECGGKEWEHQKNWLSEEPVTLWEGIKEYTRIKDGKEEKYVGFNFIVDNKLTGDLKIIDLSFASSTC